MQDSVEQGPREAKRRRFAGTLTIPYKMPRTWIKITALLRSPHCGNLGFGSLRSAIPQLKPSCQTMIVTNIPQSWFRFSLLPDPQSLPKLDTDLLTVPSLSSLLCGSCSRTLSLPHSQWSLLKCGGSPPYYLSIYLKWSLLAQGTRKNSYS